jgi:hypothetical protein
MLQMKMQKKHEELWNDEGHTKEVIDLLDPSHLRHHSHNGREMSSIEALPQVGAKV